MFSFEVFGFWGNIGSLKCSSLIWLAWLVILHMLLIDMVLLKYFVYLFFSHAQGCCDGESEVCDISGRLPILHSTFTTCSYTDISSRSPLPRITFTCSYMVKCVIFLTDQLYHTLFSHVHTLWSVWYFMTHYHCPSQHSYVHLLWSVWYFIADLPVQHYFCTFTNWCIMFYKKKTFTHIIAFIIFWCQSHVSLCVDCIIISPVCDRSHRYTTRVHICVISITQCMGCHKTTIWLQNIGKSNISYLVIRWKC